ncbi:hypothetical protein MRX96_014289 [Rhipicephalus microplus]
MKRSVFSQARGYPSTKPRDRAEPPSTTKPAAATIPPATSKIMTMKRSLFSQARGYPSTKPRDRAEPPSTTKPAATTLPTGYFQDHDDEAIPSSLRHAVTLLPSRGTGLSRLRLPSRPQPPSHRLLPRS